MKLRRWCLLLGIVGLSISPLSGQNDAVRLFQTFYEDAARADNPYGQAFFGYSDFSFGTAIDLGVNAGLPLSDRFEVAAGLTFLSLSPDGSDSQSGIADLPVYGKYFIPVGRTQVVAGGFVTLPIGSEDIGGGDVDLGGFGSLRHPLSQQVTLAGTLGLIFDERGEDRVTSLKIAGGLIYQSTPELGFIGELNLETKNNVGLLSGGVDYRSSANSHFRALLGLGVDDGSPDFTLQVSFLTYLQR